MIWTFSRPEAFICWLTSSADRLMSATCGTPQLTLGMATSCRRSSTARAWFLATKSRTAFMAVASGWGGGSPARHRTARGGEGKGLAALFAVLRVLGVLVVAPFLNHQ